MDFFTETILPDGRREYLITQGPAFIGYFGMGRNDFQVIEIQTGRTWAEGAGEEMGVIARSEEAAWAYYRRLVHS